MTTPPAGVVIVVLVAAGALRAIWVQSAVTARRWEEITRAGAVSASGLTKSSRWGASLRGIGRRRRPDLVAFTETCARTLRSGGTLAEALADAGHGTPGLDADMIMLRRHIDTGSSMPAALERWAEERKDPDIDLVVATCRLGNEMGGPLAEAFETIGGSVRARRDVAAEARSLSSQARASAALLVALPVLVGVLTIAVDPSTRHLLLATPVGWACLLGAMALDAAGITWMRVLLGRTR